MAKKKKKPAQKTAPAKPADTQAKDQAVAMATAANVPTARFDPAGGPLSAQVSSGFAQPGSYTLFLWELNENTIVMEKAGNFLNSDDDEYQLPGTNAQQDGRYAQALVTVAITPPELHYAVALSVIQDGKTLATDLKSGTGTAGDVITRTLWVLSAAQ
ncbi:MAG: hypothetical protein ABI647_01520 [Gemmatimonadota bacterium]